MSSSFKKILLLTIFASFFCEGSLRYSKASFSADMVFDRFKSCAIRPNAAISPWEVSACTIHYTAMLATATAAIITVNALTGGIGAPASLIVGVAAGSAYTGILLGASVAIGNGASLCDYNGHPYPYTNEQITQILKSQGIKPTINNIAIRYTKLCLDYMGHRVWISPDECVWIAGAMFCGFYPFASNAIACVRVGSTCPCSAAIAGGHLIVEEYEKDSSGKIKLDDKGNPIIAEEEAWRQGYLKHCRMLNNAVIPPFPEEYKGIIDASCNSMVGYSKNPTTITAGVVQCLENTARNIFEKPLIQSNSKNDVALNAQQTAIVDDYNRDIIFINDVRNRAVQILNGPYAAQLATSPNITALVTSVGGIADKSALSQRSVSYTNSVSRLQINKVANSINSMAINSTIAELDNLLSTVRSLSKDFVSSSQQANVQEDGVTLFDSIQGTMKVLGLVVIILGITIAGLQIILQELSIEFKVLLPYILKFSLVYYFAIGTAWKDYFFGMLFSISNGFGSMMLDLGDADDQLSKACSYAKNYYIPEEVKPKVCNYPNPKLSAGVDPKDPFVVGFDKKTGAKIEGCLKGPFIPRPNYEVPYNPVYYTTITPNGDSEEVAMQIYCLAKDSSSVPALPIKDPVTNKLQKWACPANTVMEDGYRLSEYIKLGLVGTDNLDTDTNYQLISTARKTLDDNQDVIATGPVYQPKLDAATNNILRVADAQKRLSQMQYLESVRSYVNRVERQYPTINHYGKNRDMRYISMFDTVDCKLRSYLTMRVPQALYIEGSAAALVSTYLFGILFSTGIFGLLLFILQLLICFFIFGVVAKVVQSYLMSIIAIVVLVYLSPITIPLCLFEQTKSYYTSWLKLLQSYVIYPPMLFLLLAFTMRIMDYVIYGSPSSFIDNNMFTADGSVDGLRCWNNDIGSAPMVCLLKKIGSSLSSTMVLGMNLPMISHGEILGTLVIQTLKTAVILYVLFEFVTHAESTLEQIFDARSADTKLGIFDDIKNNARMPYAAAGAALNKAKQAYAARSSGAKAAPPPTTPSSPPAASGGGSTGRDASAGPEQTRG